MSMFPVSLRLMEDVRPSVDARQCFQLIADASFG